MSEETFTIEPEGQRVRRLEATHLPGGNFGLECWDVHGGARIVVSRAEAMNLHAWLGRRFMVGANDGAKQTCP